MVAALSLTFLLVTAPARQEEPRFGKTNAEILKMGRSAWTKFAAEDRMEGTTAGYVSSESTYGEALRERNDRLGSTKPALRNSVVGVRKALSEYANEFIAVGSGITGGGTMWNLVSAAISPDVEEILYTVFVPAKTPRKGATVAQIDAAIAFATKTVQRKRKQIDSNRTFSHMGYTECMASLAHARKLKAAALEHAKALPKPTQAAVRRYLLDAANLDMAE